MECDTFSFVFYASLITCGLCVCVFDIHVTLLANGIILQQNKRYELVGNAVRTISQHHRYLEAKPNIIPNSHFSCSSGDLQPLACKGNINLAPSFL